MPRKYRMTTTCCLCCVVGWKWWSCNHSDQTGFTCIRWVLYTNELSGFLENGEMRLLPLQLQHCRLTKGQLYQKMTASTSWITGVFFAKLSFLECGHQTAFSTHWGLWGIAYYIGLQWGHVRNTDSRVIPILDLSKQRAGTGGLRSILKQPSVNTCYTRNGENCYLRITHSGHSLHEARHPERVSRCFTPNKRLIL